MSLAAVSYSKRLSAVEAGRHGAAKRWGPGRRTVRLDDLTPDERRLVLALVDGARAAEGSSQAGATSPSAPEAAVSTQINQGAAT
jgi:hypothetical protein